MDNKDYSNAVPMSIFDMEEVRRKPALLWGVLGVIDYEIRRALTPLRILVWCAMMLFPVFLVTMVTYTVNRAAAEGRESQIAFTFMLFVLLPEVITILGMLLWATPIVNAELESQTWVYSIVRPGARWAMLLGKFVVSVLWTSSCTCVSATLCVPITGMEDPLNTWFVLCGLCVLSSTAHGALFLLIGSLFQKRAMVFAFAYAIIVEGILGWIPAVINKFTIAFRLRSIIFQALDLKLEQILPNSELLASSASVEEHVGVLFLAVLVLLGVSLWRIQRSQYSMQSELS